MRATAWRLQDASRWSSSRAPADEPPAHGPGRRRVAATSSRPGVDVGYHTAMEYRFVTGAFLELGPAVVWMRMRHPLVEGEEPSPLQRVLVAADSGNGVSAALDYRRYLFINTDLTVHLHRGPETEWVCLDAVTRLDPAGVGMSDTAAVGRARPDRPGRSDAPRTPTGVDFSRQGYAPEREDQVGGLRRRAWRARARQHRPGARVFDHAPPAFSGVGAALRPRSTPAARTPSGSSSPRSRPATRTPTSTSSRSTASRTPRSARSAAGANAAGQTIVSADERGRRRRAAYVFGHPSATCPGVATGVTGLQHDAEAAPKGDALLQWPNPYVDTSDTQIVVDATDATGRCHDQGTLAIADAQAGRARDRRRHRPDGTDRDRPDLARRPGAHGQRRPEAPAHRVRVELGLRQLRPRRASARTTRRTRPPNSMDGIEVVDMSTA